MMSSEKTEQIVPAFQFDDINQSVVLAKDTVTIRVDDKTYTGNGEVQLQLVPRATIQIVAEFQTVPVSATMQCAFGQDGITSLTFGAKNVPGFSLGVGGNANQQTMNLRWYPKSEPVVGIGDDSTIMQRLVFHLFNFNEILSTRRSSERSGSTTHAIEHVDLVTNDWQVELRSLSETRDRIKKLKAEGGYGLTHIGLLRKEGSSFSGKEAEKTLNALRFFFSLARGSWANPVCAVGFDDKDNRVWESWSSPKEAWFSPISWFDPHHCEQLATLFPGFMSKWYHEYWRDALHEVIYWYLNSNHSSRGIDAGIILTQAAIERLSYEYAVKDRKLIEANGFKNLRASDKFRLLFSSLDIPIDIPTSLSEMTKFAGQFNWLDSPHALTEMRNSLVHPEHKRRGQYSDAYFEAWNLGLWYLELALLRICGYVGSYCNRLNVRWVGTVEDVPWQQ